MKQIYTLFIALTLLGTTLHAQSLRGKPIYVSNSQEVKLKFKSSVDNYSFVNKIEANRFNIKVYGNKNVVITSTTPNFKTSTLVITEGNNTHLFILEYKEQLNNQTVYDYSTKEKLLHESQLLAKGIKGVPEKDRFVNYVTSADFVHEVLCPAM